MRQRHTNHPQPLLSKATEQASEQLRLDINQTLNILR